MCLGGQVKDRQGHYVTCEYMVGYPRGWLEDLKRILEEENEQGFPCPVCSKRFLKVRVKKSLVNT